MDALATAATSGTVPTWLAAVLAVAGPAATLFAAVYVQRRADDRAKEERQDNERQRKADRDEAARIRAEALEERKWAARHERALADATALREHRLAAASDFFAAAARLEVHILHGYPETQPAKADYVLLVEHGNRLAWLFDDPVDQWARDITQRVSHWLSTEGSAARPGDIRMLVEGLAINVREQLRAEPPD